MNETDTKKDNLVFLHYPDHSIARQVAKETVKITSEPAHAWSVYNGGVVAVPEWMMLRIEKIRRLPVNLAERLDDVSIDEAVRLHQVFRQVTRANSLHALLNVVATNPAVFPFVDGSSLHPNLSGFVEALAQGRAPVGDIPQYFDVANCIATYAAIGILGSQRLKSFLRSAYSFSDFTYIGSFIRQIYEDEDPYALCREAPNHGITITAIDRSDSVFEVSVDACSHHSVLGSAGEGASFIVEYEGHRVRTIQGGLYFMD